MIPYEQRLDQNLRWAFMQGSLHFERANWVHQTLEKIIRDLKVLAIPCAVSGVMAMYFHGYRRFTEVVEVLITKDGLNTLHQHAERLGYVAWVLVSQPLQARSDLRDVETGVRIKFQVQGDFVDPNNPVVYPDPALVGVDLEGVRCVRLPALVELKLAAGINPGRLQHLVDAQTLMRHRDLPAELAEELHPSVRDQYHKLWLELRAEVPSPDQ